MKGNKLDQQFNCKDCSRYSLCRYYSRRKKESEICHYFHLFPDNPTNGDVIKAVFPNAKAKPWNFRMWVDLDDYQSMICDSYWWDAPYKREVEE